MKENKDFKPTHLIDISQYDLAPEALKISHKFYIELKGSFSRLEWRTKYSKWHTAEKSGGQTWLYRRSVVFPLESVSVK